MKVFIFVRRTLSKLFHVRMIIGFDEAILEKEFKIKSEDVQRLDGHFTLKIWL